MEGRAISPIWRPRALPPLPPEQLDPLDVQEALPVTGPPGPQPQSPRSLDAAIARDKLNASLASLDKAVDGLLMPDLKAAIGSLTEIIKTAVNDKPVKNSHMELVYRLNYLVDTIVTPMQGYHQLRAPPGLRKRVEQLTRELANLASNWKPVKLARSGRSLSSGAGGNSTWALRPTYLMGSVNLRLSELTNMLVEENQTAAIIAGAITKDGPYHVEKHQLSKEIGALPHADAAFDCGSQLGTDTCFSGTQEKALIEIYKWFKGGEAPIYALKGYPGVGKTTIARTIAIVFARESALAASFFFCRSNNDRNNARTFISTTAFQIARHDEEFAQQLCEVLRDSPRAGWETVAEQFHQLILRPLRAVANMRPMCIVLDALDECKEAKEILWCLMNAIPQLPTTLRIFITMRSDHQLQATLAFSRQTRASIIGTLDAEAIQDDIRFYLDHQLSGVTREKLPDRELKIEPQEIEALVQVANGLFVVASSVERFTKDNAQLNPRDQLKLLLEDIKNNNSVSLYAKLDSLYTQILEIAVALYQSSSTMPEQFQDIIGLVMILQHPLPVKSLAALLEVKTTTVEDVMQPLHSVIISNHDDQSPHNYHPSFLDFITNPHRCENDKLRVDTKVQHAHAAENCLDLMGRRLKRNIFNLPDDDVIVTNFDIPDLASKINTYIAPELMYACCYWAVHLSKGSSKSVGVMKKLEIFVKHHLSFWLEALSLTGNLHRAHPALELAEISCTSHGAPRVVLAALIEAKVLLEESYDRLKVSALLVYNPTEPAEGNQEDPSMLPDPNESEVDTIRSEAFLLVLRRFQRASWPSSSASQNYDKLDLSTVVNYEHDPVANGQFADVYKGKLSEQTSVNVAVKILRLPSYHPYNKDVYEKVFLRFIREMTVWADLKHINIVQMKGFTTARGRIGLISLWHANGTLVDHLDTTPDASVPDLMLDVAEGTQYLHDVEHIIHGDLKGMNVLINENGIACLTDFGISQQMENVNQLAGFATTSVAVGTTCWMAPETIQECPLDSRSDVYSCAGVFLEICTRKHPFYYLSRPLDVLLSKSRGEIPDRARYAGLDGKDGLWDLFTRCWDAEPASRPTITAVVQTLYDEYGLTPRVDDTMARRPLKVELA